VSGTALLVCILPVAVFLGALVFVDSYKLVRLRLVLGVVGAGALAAAAAYAANGALLSATGWQESTYSRLVAPFVEELLKGLVVLLLARTHRIAFLVDAAILGFAAGAGFAMVENAYYLQSYPASAMGLWIVRGFGTALMHGGATALFAVAGMALQSGAGAATALRFVPGYLAAVALHSTFNHFADRPLVAAIGTALLLPVLLHVAFERSERAVGQWLGQGFDADAEMLELIHSGRLSDSHVGSYLQSLKSRFHGPVVADILCYIRLYTELALRAKGILIMRENGFEAAPDEPTRAKFEEMRYLERSIGATGLRAVRPMLHISQKELWQMYMLDK
jgi:RsiW-degrading membrane proteinase PrsW (M82 family)